MNVIALIAIAQMFVVVCIYVARTWPRHDPTDDRQWERRQP